VLALESRSCAALGAIDCAIELDPRDPWNYILRGTIHSSTGDASQSAADYQRAREFRILGEHLGDWDDGPPASGTGSAQLRTDCDAGARKTSEAPSRARGADPQPAADFRKILAKMLFYKE
jgi:hypothetical protein